ncbi:MAG: FAD-dependent oxidoreductase, partial [Actinobacteria bacterium]|nr:FAD-dependent oxidoreductase [Actinomycetota bacterium]
MTKIAVVGAGQAGLLAAHALHDAGYSVTLYSDKTPEDFLERSRPTGTAGRFNMSIEWERELGLAHWDEEADFADGVFLTLAFEPRVPVLTLLGRLSGDFCAIDVRLQSASWMRELAEKGAQVEIEEVTVERLDEITGENDLTIVATGTGEIQRLLPVDGDRTTYQTPQRQLGMVNVTGIPIEIPYAPHILPIKFNAYPPFGEAFWVPWFSKDHKHCWSLVFEGKEGGPIDKFRDVSSVDEAWTAAKGVIEELMPWDYEWLRDAEPVDENAWQRGAFAPTVRKPVASLPSGRNALALGDAAQTLDPIGGQGANNGNKMAKNLVECILERGDGPFDPEWMQSTFDRFWDRHRHIEMWNNTLLEPMPESGMKFQQAAYGASGRADDTSPQQRLA